MRWMGGKECMKIHLFTREIAADGYNMRRPFAYKLISENCVHKTNRFDFAY